MKTVSASGPQRRSMTLGIVVTVIWVVTFFAARFVLDKGFITPQSVKIGVALLPVIPTALFLWVVVSAIRGLDEFHRKVHLEALVIAFPLSILMLVTLGFLQLAIDLPAKNFNLRHIWAFMPVIYFASLAITWRRYQ